MTSQNNVNIDTYHKSIKPIFRFRPSYLNSARKSSDLLSKRVFIPLYSLDYRQVWDCCQSVKFLQVTASIRHCILTLTSSAEILEHHFPISVKIDLKELFPYSVWSNSQSSFVKFALNRILNTNQNLSKNFSVSACNKFQHSFTYFKYRDEKYAVMPTMFPSHESSWR